MSEFAKATSVSPEKTQAEIQRLLQRYGATAYTSGWSGDTAFVGFTVRQRTVRFVLRLPARTDRQFTRTPTGKGRSAAQALEAWEQAVRSRWRGLLLVIKAKLEAVASGIAVFEEEFLAYIVLPGQGGRTVGDEVIPQVADHYKGGGPVRLLPLLGDKPPG